MPAVDPHVVAARKARADRGAAGRAAADAFALAATHVHADVRPFAFAAAFTVFAVAIAGAHAVVLRAAFVVAAPRSIAAIAHRAALVIAGLCSTAALAAALLRGLCDFHRVQGTGRGRKGEAEQCGHAECNCLH